MSPAPHSLSRRLALPLLLLLSVPCVAVPARILDLRRTNLAQGVELQHGWTMYWNRLWSPDDISRSAIDTAQGMALESATSWYHRSVGGKALPDTGFATYRLRLLVDTARVKRLAISTREEISAYRVWADGKPVLENGTVGTSRAAEVPSLAYAQAEFPVSSPQVELVVQISNFHALHGGFSSPFLCASPDSLSHRFRLLLVGQVLCLGVMLLFAFQYLAAFAAKPSQKPFLVFALYCLGWAAFVFCESGDLRIAPLLFPTFSVTALLRSQMLALAALPVLWSLFCRLLLPHHIFRFLTWANALAGTAFATLVLTTPARTFLLGYEPFVLLSQAFRPLILLGLVQSIRRRVPGAGILTAGYLALAIGSLNDALYLAGVFRSTCISAYTVTLLILTQALVLARRTAATHAANETLLAQVRAKNEELERLSRVKDDFLANTSHELRTPLHGILGLAQAVLADARQPLAQGVRANITSIVASARRLTGLVNEILDFSKLRHRDLALFPEPLQLAPLVEEALASLRPQALRKGIELSHKLSDGLPPLLADRDRVLQVLFNLVGNAVKFTDAGSVRLEACVLTDFVEIRVVDTGAGIAPGLLESIFAPFEQGGGESRGGTGLGLSVSRKLVELHGGTLSASSRLGQGSVFAFTLPRLSEPERFEFPEAHAAHPPLAVADLPAEEDVAELSGEAFDAWVLAIDDEPVNLQIVRGFLEPQGIGVVALPNGREAMAKIESFHPAAVLLDVMMPGLDGYAVCAEIRARHSISELPVLFLSARSRLEDVVRGFAAGGNDYLLKPFLREEMLARVKVQMRQREAYRALQEMRQLKLDLAEAVQERFQLEMMQGRLLSLFHTLEEPILVVDESRIVRLANRATARLLGRSSEELMECPVSEVLGKNLPDELANEFQLDIIPSTDGVPLRLAVRGTFFLADGERLLALRLDAIGNPPSERSVLNLVLQELAKNEEKMIRAKEMIDSAGTEMSISSLSELPHLQEILSQVRELAKAPVDEFDALTFACEIMNDSVSLWIQATGSTKVELAEKSGLWKVHMDQNGWRRAVTMDKYLDLKKIPRLPKWKAILKTAQYVCDHAKGFPATAELQTKVAKAKAFWGV